MALFQITKSKLTLVKEVKFDLEKDLQKIIEGNLEELLGYKFVATEFSIEEFRFDTLAYDEERNSFVIIEYKNSTNYSVVDQGMSYLQTVLSRKADFVLEYNTRFLKNQKKKEDIDWSQVRVVFISPYFTNYQIKASSFKDAPFDMYEIKKFGNDTLLLNPIKRNDTKESIKNVLKSEADGKIASEIKSFSLDDYIKPDWVATRETYNELHERIMETAPSLSVVYTKHYIGYKIDQQRVFSISFFKAGPCVTFQRAKPEAFKDPEKRVTYVTNSLKSFNQDMSNFLLNKVKEDDIEYALMLIKQQLKKY